MRPLTVALCCLALGAGLVCGAFAEAPSPQGPFPGPGMGPGMPGPGGPMMMPGGGDHDVAPEEASRMDKLGAQPWRPAWAPIPLLRGELATVPFLHEMLASSDAGHRARAALVLGQIACPSSRPLLAARLADANRTVRVQAGIALACMGDARGLPVCKAVLPGADADWVRYYAVLGLWSLGSAAGREALTGTAIKPGILAARALKGARTTRFVAPPKVKSLAAGARVSPKPSAAQTWEQAADVFTVESDWWWHKGDYDQSIRAQEASVLLDPSYVETYTVIAWLQWSMGRDATAIATLKRAIAAAPKDPESHFGLGFHYFNTDRFALAEPLLKEAVRLGGDHIKQRMYAHCLERLGKLQAACQQWRAILKANPTDGAAAQNLERIETRLTSGRIES